MSQVLFTADISRRGTAGTVRRQHLQIISRVRPDRFWLLEMGTALRLKIGMVARFAVPLREN